MMQRERWDLAADAEPEIMAAQNAGALVLMVARARAKGGWPRHVFAHAASEPKPLYLDLHAPYALAHLQRLLRAGPMSLTEMLPTPDALWLQRGDGAYTSELRLGMLRRS